MHVLKKWVNNVNCIISNSKQKSKNATEWYTNMLNGADKKLIVINYMITKLPTINSHFNNVIMKSKSK